MVPAVFNILTVFWNVRESELVHVVVTSDDVSAPNLLYSCIRGKLFFSREPRDVHLYRLARKS